MPSLNKYKVEGSLRLFGNTSNGINYFFQQQQIMRIDCIEQISKQDQQSDMCYRPVPYYFWGKRGIGGP